MHGDPFLEGNGEGHKLRELSISVEVVVRNEDQRLFASRKSGAKGHTLNVVQRDTKVDKIKHQ